MITFTNRRTKLNEEPFEPVVKEFTPAQALSFLVQHELGCFFLQMFVNPHRITCNSEVFNCRDSDVFEGTAEEMRFLFLTAEYFTATMQWNHKPAVEHILSQLREDGTTKAKLEEIVCTALRSNNIRMACVLFAIGVEPTEELLRLPLDTLMTCVELTIESGCPLDEIIRQLTA